MKSLINIVGIVLIILGIITLTYQGITYTKREKIAQIGDLKLTADTEKTIYFPPLLGGLSFVGGIILLIINRRGGA
jgi:hypothetical protein